MDCLQTPLWIAIALSGSSVAMSDAYLAGVEPGITSMRELARRHGAPEVLVGQHPNSRYCWVFKDGLTLTVDGWEPDTTGYGYAIDFVSVSDWKGQLKESLRANKLLPSLSLVSDLKIGMSEDQVLTAMGMSRTGRPKGNRAFDIQIRSGHKDSKTVILRLVWDRMVRLNGIQLLAPRG
ncbi:MAG: hypothetical protein HONBIEJF_02951 [Fimbriimonadaceae bacterium]|nr:hypothetical protein [Fimbriimonadaceae bacterium]